MSDSKSILDKIINQERDTTLAEFNPFDIKKELLASLKSREAEVLIKRIGWAGEPKNTIEKIGRMDVLPEKGLDKLK